MDFDAVIPKMLLGPNSRPKQHRGRPERAGREHHLVRFDLLAAVAAVLSLVACATGGKPAASASPHTWWSGRGPVVPHDTFPADCELCHTSDDWHRVRADFAFDHGASTGVPLLGAHSGAECLRCHNDRGPVAAFAARGCAGRTAPPAAPPRLLPSCALCRAPAIEDILRRPAIPVDTAPDAAAADAGASGAWAGSAAGSPVQAPSAANAPSAAGTAAAAAPNGGMRTREPKASAPSGSLNTSHPSARRSKKAAPGASTFPNLKSSTRRRTRSHKSLTSAWRRSSTVGRAKSPTKT